jgi:hypothetical protein
LKTRNLIRTGDERSTKKELDIAAFVAAQLLLNSRRPAGLMPTRLR